MGKIKEKNLLLMLLATLIIGLLGSCNQTPPKTGTLLDFVPQDVSMVLKIKNFENLRADVAANSLLSEFKNTPPYSFFLDREAIFNNLYPTSQSLLCLNQINDSVWAYTFISKETKNIFRTDSIKNKTVESLKSDNWTLRRISSDKQVAYSTVIDSVFLISSSQQLLLDILEGKTERGATFTKVFNLPSSNGLTALISENKLPINDSTKVDFTSWSTLDVAIAPESLTATGITLATDSIHQLLNVFEGQVPQQNEVAALMPSDALGAISFTFNDAEKFQKKLNAFRGEKETIKTTGIFGAASEVGSIQLQKETAIFIKSIDPSLTGDALARFVSARENFRDIEISTFSEPALFKTTFSPLITSGKANFVFQLDHFFVFTESEISAKQVISDFQNNKTLKNSTYFENTASNLGTASSLLIYKRRGEIAETIAGFFNSKGAEEIKVISFEKFPLMALQFSYDRNFAHVTLSCKEAGAAAKTISGGVSEVFSLKLDNPLMGSPKLFTSSNGSGSKIAVQDVANKLYVISENGKILWTKSLGSAILGQPQEVEISGNQNLAFVTKEALYLLDRNGKDAKGFPIKFKDAVTQPLSVFDYDNNHNYRLVVVQGNDILMYDKYGKTVKGFNFGRAKSTVAQSPVHIRMGNKDYILIAEENGKLNILSRVGKPRVPVSKSFNFSEIPLTAEDNTFVVITAEDTKERISQDGKISTQKLDVGNNYWFAMNGSTKVTQDDNLLRINGKLAELPLGVYSAPRIFDIDRNIYVSLTEIQEKKIYIFDQNGRLLNGFPIYGTSAADLAEAGKSGTILITAKGENDSVLLYSID